MTFRMDKLRFSILKFILKQNKRVMIFSRLTQDPLVAQQLKTPVIYCNLPSKNFSLIVLKLVHFLTFMNSFSVSAVAETVKAAVLNTVYVSKDNIMRKIKLNKMT